jgi:hypothetical protein
MNVRRITTMGVMGGALAAWLAAAATSGNRQVTPTPITRTTAVEVRGAALAAEIARLHERLRPTAAPREPSRNLFQFAGTQAARPDPLAVQQPALTDAATAPAPTPPPLKLVGMAEDLAADGVVRTAIISGFDQLFLVKEGETVTLRYVVAKISVDVVELTDLGDGTTLRLALR